MNDNNYFLCGKSSIKDLTLKAEAEKTKILTELKDYLSGDIDINIYVIDCLKGYYIAGDLTVNGEICKHYNMIDLCFLDLHNLMFQKLLERRTGMNNKTLDLLNKERKNLVLKLAACIGFNDHINTALCHARIDGFDRAVNLIGYEWECKTESFIKY